MNTALRLLAILMLTIWTAGHAAAGAWPRPAGRLYAAISAYGDAAGDYAGLYLDYGLSARMSLGADLGMSAGGAAQAVVFLRAPLARGSCHIGAVLGLGRIDGAGALRLGLSVGRSIRMAGRPGWVALDGTATWLRGGGAPGLGELKADAMLGWQVTPRLTAMVQVQAAQPRSGPADVRLVPSLAWRLRGGAQIEIGLTRHLRGTAQPLGIKLGLAREF